MDAVVRTAGIITLTAWRRELSIAVVGRGYSIGLRNIALPQLVTVTCGALAISASTDDASNTTYTLTASQSGQGCAMAQFAITTDEAERIAEWLGLDMPSPLSLEQVRA